FDLLQRWSPHVRPGGWPDADMLPLGRIGIRAERGSDRLTRFTRDEQRTLIALWSIARSPLMFGGDLPSNDEFTLSLLTNDEILAANQAAGNSPQLIARGDQIAWVSDPAAGGENPRACIACYQRGGTRFQFGSTRRRISASSSRLRYGTRSYRSR